MTPTARRAKVTQQNRGKQSLTGAFLKVPASAVGQWAANGELRLTSVEKPSMPGVL